MRRSHRLDARMVAANQRIQKLLGRREHLGRRLYDRRNRLRPITLPRSPRSGIAVLRTRLRNRGREIGMSLHDDRLPVVSSTLTITHLPSASLRHR